MRLNCCSGRGAIAGKHDAPLQNYKNVRAELHGMVQDVQRREERLARFLMHEAGWLQNFNTSIQAIPNFEKVLEDIKKAGAKADAHFRKDTPVPASGAERLLQRRTKESRSHA